MWLGGWNDKGWWTMTRAWLIVSSRAMIPIHYCFRKDIGALRREERNLCLCEILRAVTSAPFVLSFPRIDRIIIFGGHRIHDRFRGMAAIRDL